MVHFIRSMKAPLLRHFLLCLISYARFERCVAGNVGQVSFVAVFAVYNRLLGNKY